MSCELKIRRVWPENNTPPRFPYIFFIILLNVLNMCASGRGANPEIINQSNSYTLCRTRIRRLDCTRHPRLKSLAEKKQDQIVHDISPNKSTTYANWIAHRAGLALRLPFPGLGRFVGCGGITPSAASIRGPIILHESPRTKIASFLSRTFFARILDIDKIRSNGKIYLSTILKRSSRIWKNVRN